MARAVLAIAAGATHFAAAVAGVGGAAAGETAPRDAAKAVRPMDPMREEEELRGRFETAFGDDFEVLRDESREMSGKEFRLFTVKPRRSGRFVFRYQFEASLGYRYQDHEFSVSVGESGCTRSDGRPDICLGDAIVVPIRTGKGLRRHRFSNVSRLEAGGEPPPRREEIDARPVANPAAGSLTYRGRTVAVGIHRTHTQASVSSIALFEAAAPGAFGLRISARLPERLRRPEPRAREEATIPVIVVPKGTPIVALAPDEWIHESDEAVNPRASSAGGWNFRTRTLRLRPGDRIRLTYDHRVVHKKDGRWEEMKPILAEIEPVLEKLPIPAELPTEETSGYPFYDAWLENQDVVTGPL